MNVDGSKFVHHLVLETFVGFREEGTEARHLNDVKSDNRLENLCWGTHGENYADRVVNGGGNQGSRHGMAKLTEDDVREIRSMYEPGVVPCRVIAERFGMSKSAVEMIVNRTRWRHVS